MNIPKLNNLFEDWWMTTGKFIDPDINDVPLEDKLKGFMEYAFEAAMAISRNYMANDSIYPKVITFKNGRVVSLDEDKRDWCLKVYTLD